jgi:hypothetical protein
MPDKNIAGYSENCEIVEECKDCIEYENCYGEYGKDK